MRSSASSTPSFLSWPRPTLALSLSLALALAALPLAGCEAIFGEEQRRGARSDDDIIVPDLEDDAAPDATGDLAADADRDAVDARADADADAGGDAESDAADLSGDRDAAEPDASDLSGGGDGGDAGDADLDAGYVPGFLEDRTRLFVCGKWENDREFAVSEGWSAADGPACDPGIMAEGAREEALRLIALYHWMVGLNAVAISSEDADADAVACATLLAEVGEASYDPPDTGACWSSDAEAVVAASVVSDGVATPVEAIDALMADTSDNRFYALRRLLDPLDVTTYGIGQVEDIVCAYPTDVVSGNQLDFVAYPNPGFSAMQAQTPWIIMGGALRFDIGTSVEVVRVSDGERVRATVRLITAPPGNGTLIVTPTAWDWDETYEVRISGADRDGVRENLRYRTTPTTCSEATEE